MENHLFEIVLALLAALGAGATAVWASMNKRMAALQKRNDMLISELLHMDLDKETQTRLGVADRRRPRR